LFLKLFSNPVFKKYNIFLLTKQRIKIYFIGLLKEFHGDLLLLYKKVTYQLFQAITIELVEGYIKS